MRNRHPTTTRFRRCPHPRGRVRIRRTPGPGFGNRWSGPMAHPSPERRSPSPRRSCPNTRKSLETDADGEFKVLILDATKTLSLHHQGGWFSRLHRRDQGCGGHHRQLLHLRTVDPHRKGCGPPAAGHGTAGLQRVRRSQGHFWKPAKPPKLGLASKMLWRRCRISSKPSKPWPGSTTTPVTTNSRWPRPTLPRGG